MRLISNSVDDDDDDGFPSPVSTKKRSGTSVKFADGVVTA